MSTTLATKKAKVQESMLSLPVRRYSSNGWNRNFLSWKSCTCYVLGGLVDCYLLTPPTMAQWVLTSTHFRGPMSWTQSDASCWAALRVFSHSLWAAYCLYEQSWLVDPDLALAQPSNSLSSALQIGQLWRWVPVSKIPGADGLDFVDSCSDQVAGPVRTASCIRRTARFEYKAHMENLGRTWPFAVDILYRLQPAYVVCELDFPWEYRNDDSSNPSVWLLASTALKMVLTKPARICPNGCGWIWQTVLMGKHEVCCHLFTAEASQWGLYA